MLPTHLCHKCDKQLTDASYAIRRHSSLMSRSIKIDRNGSLSDKQLLELASNLEATFNVAQSAWDAYRDHLIDHGLLPSKT